MSCTDGSASNDSHGDMTYDSKEASSICCSQTHPAVKHTSRGQRSRLTSHHDRDAVLSMLQKRDVERANRLELSQVVDRDVKAILLSVGSIGRDASIRPKQRTRINGKAVESQAHLGTMLAERCCAPSTYVQLKEAQIRAQTL